ncbi:hypothetical protein BH09ACT9_BH09ACT9_00130 [soil metagenome]
MVRQTVKSITVRNFEGVKEATIYPKGKGLTVISGKNGAGKSSLINGVRECIDPKGIRGPKGIARPIRDGESEAYVELLTDLARIVRLYKKNDAGIRTVYALDGAKYPSGKQFVDEATGGILWDPYEFVSLEEKDQRAQLLKAVSLPFDLDELDRKHAGAVDRRKDKKKDLDRVTNDLARLPKPDDDTPSDEVSAADIMAELDAARRANDQFDKDTTTRTELRDRVAKLEAALADARAGLAFIEGRLAKAERIDTTAIVARLDSLQQINQTVRDAQKYRTSAADVATEAAALAAVEAEIADIAETKRAGLAAAQFPVDGLGFDEDGVTFDGRPFKQLNEGEQTVVAFDLATLTEADLRLVVIKNGNDLDLDTIDRIAAKCEERGYVALMERITPVPGQLNFVIVEGESFEVAA